MLMNSKAQAERNMPSINSQISSARNGSTSRLANETAGFGIGEEVTDYSPIFPHAEPDSGLHNINSTSSQQSWFPRAHIIPVSLSEPRDVLQSERTFLSFIRFALSLFFTSIGMVIGFHLESSGDSDNDHNKNPDDEDSDPRFKASLFNHTVSIVLIFLAFATLVVAGINYFRTVRRYSMKKIKTHSTNNTIMVLCVTSVIVTLAGLNISLIVERYLKDS